MHAAKNSSDYPALDDASWDIYLLPTGPIILGIQRH